LLKSQYSSAAKVGLIILNIIELAKAYIVV